MDCILCEQPIVPDWADTARAPRTGQEPDRWLHKATQNASCDPERVATPPDGTSRPWPEIRWTIHDSLHGGMRITHPRIPRLWNEGAILLTSEQRQRVIDAINTAMAETDNKADLSAALTATVLAIIDEHGIPA